MVKMENEYKLYLQRKECRYFNECNAQFCPLAMNDHAVWLPDEGICRRPDFSSNLIIQNQRKIKKKSGDPWKYFTYKMLNREFVIGKKIDGIDADIPEKMATREGAAKLYMQRGEEWFKKHPVKSDKVKEQQIKRGQHLFSARQASILINEGEKDE